MKITDLIGIIIGIVLLLSLDYSFSFANGILLIVGCILVTKGIYHIIKGDKKMDVIQEANEKLNNLNGKEQFEFFMWWRGNATDYGELIRFKRITSSDTSKLDGYDWSIIAKKLNEYEGETK